MGQHGAPLPPERRLLGGGLATATVLLLVWLIWAISQPVDSPATTGQAESPTTTATSAPTTSTTTTPTTTNPPTTAPATASPSTTIPPIQLLPDGLGVAGLGDPADQALAAVGEILGPPDEDSGWLSARSEFGTCPGTVVRVVRWSSLRLFFSDGPTDFAEDSRHFFYYSQSPVTTSEALDLKTPDGIGLGSTVSRLEDVYGRDLTITSTVRFGPVFSVEATGPGLTSGSLTGIGADDTVVLIGGGFGCGG
jgi:hypothetical protein